jgi:predicted nucleic-acid-binding protein
MIALDTNVLIRFLVEDDAAQSQRAARLVDRAIDASESLFVSDIVLAETAWVLTRAYGISKTELLRVLRQLQAAKHLQFESSDVLAHALDVWEAGKGDFSDYLILSRAQANGCEAVATFDKALLKERHFTRP